MWRMVIILVQLWMTVYTAEDTLRQVHVVFRHCERTPSESELYRNSPYYNESNFAPYGYSQLTNIGKKNCYDIGKALRKRYEGFIDPAYHYSIVEGISSSQDRSKESLQLFLAGLFPPTDKLRWSTELNWVPIATYYEQKALDMVLTPMSTKKYIKEYSKFLKTDEAHSLAAPYTALKKYISENTDEEFDFTKLGQYCQGMLHLKSIGFVLPKWMETIYPNEVEKYIVEYLYKSFFATEKLRRMASGYIMRKIFDEVEMKINGSLVDKQIIIYSGHDLTIIALFLGLDLWDGLIPALGSYCLLELHYINNVYGFMIYYFNETSGHQYSLHPPGYSDFISFQELKVKKRKYLHLEDLEGHSNAPKSEIHYMIFVLLVSLASRS